MNLTGRTRFRANWRGKLLLQVEVVGHGGYRGDKYQFWRDAETQDLSELQHLNYSRIDVYLPQPDDVAPQPGGNHGPRSTH